MHCKQKQTSTRFKQKCAHCKLKFLHDANKIKGLARVGRREGLRLSQFPPYMYKAKEELKAIIQHAGPPTFFFTFSAADMHWPELHALLGSNNTNDDNQSEVRCRNVINNPYIVDWFLTERLKNCIKHWLYDTLDASWHCHRFEYQSRGSIHCHGLAKLKMTQSYAIYNK